jgi:hypothetical protein
MRGPIRQHLHLHTVLPGVLLHHSRVWLVGWVPILHQDPVCMAPSRIVPTAQSPWLTLGLGMAADMADESCLCYPAWGEPLGY